MQTGSPSAAKHTTARAIPRCPRQYFQQQSYLIRHRCLELSEPDQEPAHRRRARQGSGDRARPACPCVGRKVVAALDRGFEVLRRSHRRRSHRGRFRTIDGTAWQRFPQHPGLLSTGYSPSDSRMDGRFRQIRVRFRHKPSDPAKGKEIKPEAIARRGYYAVSRTRPEYEKESTAARLRCAAETPIPGRPISVSIGTRASRPREFGKSRLSGESFERVLRCSADLGIGIG